MCTTWGPGRRPSSADYWSLPFRKIVYSSDGFGPAELHFLGATLWRSGIQRVLRGFVERDDWCETDALRVVDLIAHGTAARIYRLGDR